MHRRAFKDTTGKIFTILHANRIGYDSSAYIEQLLSKPTSNNFRLVFISGAEGNTSDKSYMTTAFEKNMVTTPSLPQDKILRDYLKKNLKIAEKGHSKVTAAAGHQIDPGQSMLRLVTSMEYGNGKRSTKSSNNCSI